MNQEQTQPLTTDQAEAIKQYFARLFSGLCVVCTQPIEKKVQVGCCVYAEPCGHRQYHGKV